MKKNYLLTSLFILIVLFCGLSNPAKAINIINTINTPTNLALNSKTNKLYSPSSSTNDLLIVDTATNKFIGAFKYNDNARESNFSDFSSGTKTIKVDETNNKVYINDRTGIYVFDTNSNKPILTIPVSCDDFEIDPITNKLWAADISTGALTIVNLLDENLPDSINVKIIKTGEKASVIIFDEIKKVLYISDKDTLKVFDTTSEKVTNTIGVGDVLASTLILDEKNNRLYGLSSSNSDLITIDTENNKLLTRTAQPNSSFFFGQSIAFNPSFNLLYIIDFGSITVYNALTEKFIDILPMEQSFSFRTNSKLRTSGFNFPLINLTQSKLYSPTFGGITITDLPTSVTNPTYLNTFKDLLKELKDLIDNIDKTEKISSPLNTKLKPLLVAKYNSFITLLEGSEKNCSFNFSRDLQSIFNPPSKEYNSCCIARKSDRLEKSVFWKKDLKNNHNLSACRDCMLNLDFNEFFSLFQDLNTYSDIDLSEDNIIDACQIQEKNFEKF